MKLKKIIATSLTMAMAFTLAPIAVPNQSKAATATITLSGSTSISPLAQQLAKQYVKENKGIKINFTNITGSGSGISDAMNGKVDIGMSSRALKADEAAVLKANVICNDGIAIVVNKSNPVGNITPEQLYDLYAKKTTNWKSIVSSYNKAAAVYGRESGSGTRSCFEDVLKNDFKKDIAKNYGKLDAEISTTGAMQTSVKTNPGAIGYPANAVNKAVKFKSSNKKVATVSKKGVIKAKKKGKATITITTVEGNVKAKIKVTVKKK